MQLGVIFPQTEIGEDPAVVRDFAQTAEGLGYDYLVAYDHVIGADPERHQLTGTSRPANPYTHRSMFHEVFVLFGYLAGLTERIQLMTGVLILPQRQTALVAKQAAEVDVLSGGRLVLGVGVGWNHVEYESLRQDYHTRGARLEEQVGLLRALWADPLVEFEGRFDSVQHAGINPLPGRRIPIWMGGWADVVLDRIGRVGDGWLAAARSRSEFATLVGKIHDAARAAGRDPAEIAIGNGVSAAGFSVEQQVERALHWRDAGATHCSMLTMDSGFTSPQQHLDAIRDFREAYGQPA